MANAKIKSDKLVVTNYDNFKNADFFIKQYFEAKKMLKEVDEFFDSFVMSKLIESNGFSKKDVKIKDIELNPWVKHFYSDDDCYRPSTWRGKICHMQTYERKLDEHYHWLPYTEEQAKNLQDLIIEMKRDNLLDKNPKYNTYYVIDQKGCLHDFIPVACKDTIKIDFDKKNIKVSGHYYQYTEWGGRWGRSESRLDKIIVTIKINPSNNNIVSVDYDEDTMQEGNANGKSYYDSHDDYCMTSMKAGKNQIITPRR